MTIQRSNPTGDIWRDFEARLRAFVRRRADPLWVDDIVGDIMLRLVKHREAFETADSPVAYMLRVANNAITDHYRRCAVEARALADVEVEARTEEALSAGHESSDDAKVELARCILPFIQHLPAAYREALVLTDIGGLTQVDAAEQLGLSISGMKSRVQRGRAKLKQALQNCCPIEVDGRGRVIDFEAADGSCGDCLGVDT